MGYEPFFWVVIVTDLNGQFGCAIVCEEQVLPAMLEEMKNDGNKLARAYPAIIHASVTVQMGPNR